MRPRIGVTTSSLDHTPEGALRLCSVLYTTYAQHIFNAGGQPFLLPSLAEQDAVEILATLDGLLLSGGGDFDPALWGEAMIPECGTPNTLRDALEIDLIQEALRRDLPVLGICRGVQALAVAGGGSLWQDIPSQCPDCLVHAQTIERNQPSHMVAITPGSLLADLFPPKTSGESAFTLHVNSLHHQAPKNCGRVFTAIAASPDGIIEALTASEATFILGVQWHPEVLLETDPRHTMLFQALVNAARGAPIRNRA
ncbi:MAG: gamma-glutamyl-gamma-aminobutyrate hydrolase family protein [Armatimonadota bacterium]